MGILATSIDLLPNGTFFFQLVIFGLAIAILNWGVFGPITRVLDLRQRKTVGDSAEASEILARAEALATQYADKIRETRITAQETKEALRQEGFAKATDMMNAARSESLAELEAARAQIATQVNT
jgi:F-type H+-transporting ATPase subunit b